MTSTISCLVALAPNKDMTAAMAHEPSRMMSAVASSDVRVFRHLNYSFPETQTTLHQILSTCPGCMDELMRAARWVCPSLIPTQAADLLRFKNTRARHDGVPAQGPRLYASRSKAPARYRLALEPAQRRHAFSLPARPHTARPLARSTGRLELVRNTLNPQRQYDIYQVNHEYRVRCFII